MRTAKIGQESGQFLRASGQVFRGRQPRTGRTETRTTGQLDIQIRTSRTVNSDNRTKELGYLLLRADGESGGYLFFMLDRNLGQAGQKAGQFSSDERTGFSREATSDRPDKKSGQEDSRTGHSDIQTRTSRTVNLDKWDDEGSDNEDKTQDRGRAVGHVNKSVAPDSRLVTAVAKGRNRRAKPSAGEPRVV